MKKYLILSVFVSCLMFSFSGSSQISFKAKKEWNKLLKSGLDSTFATVDERFEVMSFYQDGIDQGKYPKPRKKVTYREYTLPEDMDFFSAMDSVSQTLQKFAFPEALALANKIANDKKEGVYLIFIPDYEDCLRWIMVDCTDGSKDISLHVEPNCLPSFFAVFHAVTLSKGCKILLNK